MNNTAKYMRFSREELAQEASMGRPWQGNAALPYGYRKEEGKLLLDEEKAQIIRTIFHAYMEGASYKAIANQLTTQKFPTPSQDKKKKNAAPYWNAATVKGILGNRAYTGVRTVPGTGYVEENVYPIAVDKHLFEETARRMERCLRNWRRGQEHLLDGKVFCADCGAAMSVVRKSASHSDLVCSAWKRKKTDGICSAHSIREDTVINAVLTQLYVIAKSLNTDALMVMYREKECEKLLNGLKNRIRENKDALLSLYKDKCRGIVDESEYTFLAADLKKEIGFYESQLSCFTEIYDERNYYAEAKRVLNDILNFEKIHKSILDMLIRKICIFADGRMVIEFNFTEPDESDKISL